MKITRINNDINGNSRLVVHFLELLTREERQDKSVSDSYNYALKKARKFGGGKFHNKQFGGGVVFSCYDRNEVREIVYSIKGEAIFDNYKVERVFIQSQVNGKMIKIKMMFTDSEECNFYLSKHKEMGVIDRQYTSIFVANNKD